MPRQYTRIPPEQRFWAKVDKSGECWVWTGWTTPNGYGGMWTPSGTKHLSAHRFSYELHYGPIPHGMHICHRCDNRVCVRPDHLFLGTPADNIHDAMSKGRSTRGEHVHTAKLTEVQVREIRNRAASGVRRRQLAQEYGVTIYAIKSIVERRSWRHLS